MTDTNYGIIVKNEIEMITPNENIDVFESEENFAKYNKPFICIDKLRPEPKDIDQLFTYDNRIHNYIQASPGLCLSLNHIQTRNELRKINFCLQFLAGNISYNQSYLYSFSKDVNCQNLKFFKEFLSSKIQNNDCYIIECILQYTFIFYLPIFVKNGDIVIIGRNKNKGYEKELLSTNSITNKNKDSLIMFQDFDNWCDCEVFIAPNPEIKNHLTYDEINDNNDSEIFNIFSAEDYEYYIEKYRNENPEEYNLIYSGEYNESPAPVGEIGLNQDPVDISPYILITNHDNITILELYDNMQILLCKAKKQKGRPPKNSEFLGINGLAKYIFKEKINNIKIIKDRETIDLINTDKINDTQIENITNKLEKHV